MGNIVTFSLCVFLNVLVCRFLQSVCWALSYWSAVIWRLFKVFTLFLTSCSCCCRQRLLTPASTCFSSALFACSLDDVYFDFIPTGGLFACYLSCVVLFSHHSAVLQQRGVLPRREVCRQVKLYCHLCLPCDVSVSDKTGLTHAHVTAIALVVRMLAQHEMR